ncbi:MAG TPA: hypothetical protein PKD31_04460, partial [Blastocatellia bacterium]|nr:hypothetical protein [Blastocatellia bacterium]
MAQVQGTDFPANSPISDQKPGSVLVFPLYSSTANGIAENTRIAITNLGAATAYLRLYLVNGGSGQVNSFQDCLIANQTHSFTASDVDPMVRGFIVVVAVGTDGKPVKYNFLAGEEDI